MSAAARIIDANANRAREALRTIEDTARFALDDATLSASAKQLRHELQQILDRLPDGWLELHRDTRTDVGTEIRTTSEMTRRSIHDVAIAAGKRLTEALRVLEETLKTVDSAAAAETESLRYRAYTLDQQVHAALSTHNRRQWRVCVLLTESLCRGPWMNVADAALAGGADCLQLREKNTPPRELLKRATALASLAHAAGAALIINDRPDIALLAGADGVHLGQDDLPIEAVRRMAGRSLLIGVSTHDASERRAAIDAGASYIGVGTIFDSSTRPDRAPSGIKLIETLGEDPVAPWYPHLAIGGITPDNAQALAAAGCRGIAVSSCVCGAEDPEQVVRTLVGLMQEQSTALVGSCP